MPGSNSDPTESDRSTSSAGGINDSSEERDGAHLLGATSRGAPIYYDPVEHRQLEGPAEGAEAGGDAWISERSLDDDTSVPDLVDEIADAVGWDALTDYAEEHLPGPDDGGDSGGDGEA